MSKDQRLVNGDVIKCSGCGTELIVGTNRIHPQTYGRFCGDCTKFYSDFEVDLRKFYFKWDMERASFIQQIKDKHFKRTKQVEVADIEKPVEAAKAEVSPVVPKVVRKRAVPIGAEGMADDKMIAELDAETKNTQVP